MPRYSKQRGKQSAYRGISHYKVCVISAVDENDQMLFQVTGLGVEIKTMINSIKPFISKEKEHKYQLISDMKQVYKELADTTNREHIQIKSTSYTAING